MVPKEKAKGEKMNLGGRKLKILSPREEKQVEKLKEKILSSKGYLGYKTFFFFFMNRRNVSQQKYTLTGI